MDSVLKSLRTLVKGITRHHRWFVATTRQSTEKNPAGAGYSLTVKAIALELE
jgi:hypothetical protein